MEHDAPTLALVLHAHLPFVRHPEHDDFLEERWLFEAIAETYVPLLRVLDGLVVDHLPHRLTLSISPTLLDMLSDRLLQARCVRYLDLRCAFAEKQLRRNERDDRMQRVALLYRDLLARTRTFFVEALGCELVPAFRRHQESGGLEIIACAATHGFLPALRSQPAAVEAQIAIGIDEYRRFFGRDPLGFWLPECGYVPGFEEILARHGIRWFLVESHGLLEATPRPLYATFAPVITPAGVAAFGRDAESSRQVWSAVEGYPGDPFYRDFHRDLGFDLSLEDLDPLLPAPGVRVATGFKYHRVTGPGSEKDVYDPERAAERVEAHAAHFVAERTRQFAAAAAAMRRPPIVVAPYDAELFGHWWFEGPAWLDRVMRLVAQGDRGFSVGTPGDHLARHPVAQEATPAASTWGEGGHAAVWLSPANDWAYRHLDAAAERMVGLASAHRASSGDEREALEQAARELLLAQASDWAFLLSRGTAPDYARQRIRTHLGRFAKICDGMQGGGLDREWLAEIERRDDVFPGIDVTAFVRRPEGRRD